MSIQQPKIANVTKIDNSAPQIIEKYDVENPNSSIILLLWAGNVDDLRYDIEVK